MTAVVDHQDMTRLGIVSLGILVLSLLVPYLAWDVSHVRENWFLLGAFASVGGGVSLYVYLGPICGRKTLAAKSLCAGFVCFDGLRCLRSIMMFNSHYWTATKVEDQVMRLYMYVSARLIEGVLLGSQPLLRAERALVLALAAAFDGFVWGAAAFETGDKRLLLLHNGAPFLLGFLVCLFCFPKAEERAGRSATIKDVTENTETTSKISGADEGCAVKASPSALRPSLSSPHAPTARVKRACVLMARSAACKAMLDAAGFALGFWVAFRYIVPYELESGLPIYGLSVII
mmetsp:Transcript_5856/g.11566  ORF Transcript_5856/g.11566 Transcript_5856/m.11566 type:complete len:289 (-) Transcript_5856:84-950(-)